MKYLAAFVCLLSTVSCATACWVSGCHLDSWAVVGCPSDHIEKSKAHCHGGWVYECCPRPAGDPGHGDPGVGDNDVAQITFAQFTNAVTSNGYPAPGGEKYEAFIQAAPTRGQIKSKVEAAMALAQLLHESGGLVYKTEQACNWDSCGTTYSNANCDAPGKFYFGRGYIQLTWCVNYRQASHDLFGDDTLIRDPDMVSRVEVTAWDTAFWYWSKMVRGHPGVSQGHFGASTAAINGALECHGGYYVDKARARFRIYGNVRAAFELSGPGVENGCYN